MSTGDYINNQADQERQNQIDQSSSWITPFLYGVGAIALGAYLLKSRIAENGNLTRNLFNFLGLPRGINLADAAANVAGSAARSETTGIRSILNSSFDFNKKVLNIGPIDLIDDLRNSIEIMGTRSDIGEHVAAGTTEFVNRETANFGNNAGYFTQGLQRLTFGDILADQETWRNILTPNQMGVVQRSLELNLVSASTPLDKKIFLNKKTNEVLDFRLRNLFSSVKTIETATGPVVQRVAKYDLFGQGNVVSSILGSPRNIAVLGPSDEYPGSRVFIGGNVFGYIKNESGGYTPLLLGQNRVLRRTGDAFEVIAASREGRLELTPPARSGFFGSILSWAENTLGIGPGFSNRPSIVQRLITDPYKRFKALQTGEGVILEHPYKKQFGVSKVLDAALGGEYPELAMRGGNTIPIPGGGGIVDVSQLRGNSMLLFPNRVGIFFDLVDDHSVVKKSSFYGLNDNRNALVGTDLIVPPRTGGFRIRGRQISARSAANNFTDIERGELTAAGFRSISSNYAYYDVAATTIRGQRTGLMSGLKDFAAYSLYRLNNLFSETALGIGFAPSHKISTNIARSIGVYAAYSAAFEGIKYGDYLTEKFTGVSPIKAVASVYAGARVAQQYVRNLIGLSPALAAADKYFPGSVTSEGSAVARSILAPAFVASSFLKRGSMIGALIGAASTYAAIGGPAPQQDYKDLIREYSGDKKVPVRRGQWWGMGYTPFAGGKVDRYDYSWYAKLTSDYRVKSIYGSKQEYWSYHANVMGIPFPTPSNLFGLNNLMNPYRLESMHYYDRPYPQTESDFANFPVFGPILSATVGQLIKPIRYRDPTEMPLLKAALAPSGLTASSARLYGIPGINATAQEAQDPSTPLNILAKQANIASEPLGIYKFVMQFFGVKFGTDAGTQYATSAMIGSPGRQLYDMEAGGALGQTEAIRRYLLNDYSSAYNRGQMINPIANNMPSWLPGTYSENSRDKSYFVDFTLGDAYSKIANGEARLPGAGYEALNELYSGRPGNYSDVDRFLILADVAPYSSAYKQYEKKVLSMDLDEHWKTKVQEAIQQRREVIGLDTRYKRYEEDIVALNLGIQSPVYAGARKAYDFITHDILAEIPYLGSKFFPFRSPYEQYRKTRVEGEEFASWDRPYEAIIRPGLYDMALEDPLTAAGKGATLGYLLSGPMRWFTPIRAIVGEAGGLGYNIGAVKGGALIGAALSATRIAAGYDQNMIPYHIQRENDAIQGMDTLAYIKKRILTTAGASDREATMLGAKTPISYRSALPTSSDRRFFDYFSTISDPSLREQIFQGSPAYMQEGLARTWDHNYQPEDADQVALNFINNNQIPDNNWLGWNPAVSNGAIKLRFVEHGINGVSDNTHRFGFFEQHELDLETRLADFNNQEINFVQSPMYSSFNSFVATKAAEFKGKPTLTSFGTPFGVRRDLSIKVDRRSDMSSSIRRGF